MKSVPNPLADPPIINKNKPILSNNSGEPFLENSCCDSENNNTIKNSDFSNPKQIKILGKDFVVWKKEKHNQKSILQRWKL